MVDEQTTNPEATAEEMAAAEGVAPTPEANPEEDAIAQVIQMIAGLSPEAQRQLMWFLNEQFTAVVSEEQEEIKNSPEEQARKADTMSEAF